MRTPRDFVSIVVFVVFGVVGAWVGWWVAANLWFHFGRSVMATGLALLVGAAAAVTSVVQVRHRIGIGLLMGFAVGAVLSGVAYWLISDGIVTTN